MKAISLIIITISGVISAGYLLSNLSDGFYRKNKSIVNEVNLLPQVYVDGLTGCNYYIDIQGGVTPRYDLGGVSVYGCALKSR